MPNQWGTQLSTAIPVYTALIGGANVSCPAGAETNVAQVNPLGALGPGNYAAFWQGVLCVVLGGTAPTALSIACRVGAGSDNSAIAVPPAQLVANAQLMIPITMWGVVSTSAWYPPQFAWNLTVNPTAQAVTASNSYCTLYYGLIRAQDV